MRMFRSIAKSKSMSAHFGGRIPVCGKVGEKKFIVFEYVYLTIIVSNVAKIFCSPQLLLLLLLYWFK